MTAYENLKNTISKLASVYVVFLFIAFPLFVHDMYFDIMNDKFYLFWVSCAVVTGASLIITLIYGLTDLAKDHGRGVKAFFREFLPANIRRHLSLPDCFFILFMVISILSTVLSEYPYEAFWGQYGRYQGLFLWIFYGALYVLISRFYRAKRWHFDLFLLVGVILSLWGCLDYIGADPLGWRAAIGDPSFRYDFSSGIGNVNSLTAMLALYMSAAAVMFIDQPMADFRGKCRKALYGLALLITFTAVIMSASDNGALAVGALLFVLPFYAWKNRQGTLSYLAAAALFMLAMYGTGSITAWVHEANAAAQAAGGSFFLDIMPEGKWGVLLMLSNKQTLLMAELFVILCFIGVFMYFLDFSAYQKKRKEVLGGYHFEDYMTEDTGKASRIVWGLLGLSALIGLIWLFYDANTGGHPEWYQNYSKFFIFNDRWGTNRGYNWKLIISYFAMLPLFRKFIGAGPETYGVYTGIRDYYTMLEEMNETYDSPHNEVLQYLFSVGIIGTIGYYGMVISAIFGGIFGKGGKSSGWPAKADGKALGKGTDKGNEAKADGTDPAKDRSRLRKASATTISAACAFAVLAYTAASVVNISAPTVTPMMLLLLSICVGESHKA